MKKIYVVELFKDNDDIIPAFRQCVECDDVLINNMADNLKRRLLCSRAVVKQLD